MTKKIYNIEAKGVVKVWMDVEASSQEEAEALASKNGFGQILLEVRKTQKRT